MSASLDQYGEAFRELINRKNFSKSHPVKKLLKLSKESDWRFICAAMDVIGDSESAIDNFLRFGLDGPTRYDDSGEKYLRLYGLLSATYLQQESVLELHRLMNVPYSKKARSEISSLKIRKIRNKLASHSVNYKNHELGETEAFAPVRISLQGLTCEIASLTLNLPEKIDLREALNENSSALVALMDKIYEKTYKTLFKGQQEKLIEFNEKLRDLRVARDGGTVLKLGNTKIVIHSVAPNI